MSRIGDRWDEAVVEGWSVCRRLLDAERLEPACARPQGHSVFHHNTNKVQGRLRLCREMAAGRRNVGMACPADQPDDLALQPKHVHQIRPVTGAPQHVTGLQPALLDTAMSEVQCFCWRTPFSRYRGQGNTGAMSSNNWGGFSLTTVTYTICCAIWCWVSKASTVTIRPSRTSWRSRSRTTGTHWSSHRLPVGPVSSLHGAPAPRGDGRQGHPASCCRAGSRHR